MIAFNVTPLPVLSRGRLSVSSAEAVEVQADGGLVVGPLGGWASNVNTQNDDQLLATTPLVACTRHAYVPPSGNWDGVAVSHCPDATGPTWVDPSSAPPLTYHSKVAVTANPSGSVNCADSCG